MKNPELIVDIIRHGEPVGGSRYRGDGIDDPLSERGWEQMRRAIGLQRPWQAVYSSPLRRCSEFAHWLSREHDLPVTIVDDFREVGFGQWEGKTKAELIEADAEAFERFYQDPVKYRPPGAEPLDDFLSRVRTGWRSVVENEQREQLLIVAHAGVMRAILAGVLNLDAAAMYRVVVDNAGIMRIAFRKDVPNVAWLNGKMD